MARLHTFVLIGAMVLGLTGWGAPAPVQAQKHRAAAVSEPHPEIERLSGATRYETAAAVAAYPPPTWSPLPAYVRIVRGDRPLDAVTSGTGRVLMIPARGPIPAAVGDALRRLKPAGITVVGSERTLPTAQIRRLVGKAKFTRKAEDDLTKRTFGRALDMGWPSEYGETISVSTTLVTGPSPLAQAAVSRDAIVVTPSGTLPVASKKPPVPEFSGFVVVGGPTAVTPARLKEFFARITPRLPRVERVQGTDRYGTAAALAGRDLPLGAGTVYLAEGVTGVDAAIAAMREDGPVLLVPPCGTLPESVRARLAALKPDRLVAVGSPGNLCDAMLRQARDAVTLRPAEHAVDLAKGGQCALTSKKQVWCWTQTPYGTLGTRRVTGLPADVRSVIGISAWPEAVCALTGAGAVYCTRLTTMTAVPVPGLTSGVTSLSSGTMSGLCAIKTGGTVWCQESSSDNVAAPAAPLRGALPARLITGDHFHGCSLGDAGVQCWGQWNNGRTDVSSWEIRPPTRVPNAPGDIVELVEGGQAIGGEPMQARTRDGRLFELGPDDWHDTARATWHQMATGVAKLNDRAPGCLLTTGGQRRCRSYGSWSEEQLSPPGLTDTSLPWAGGCSIVSDGGIRCANSANAWVPPLRFDGHPDVGATSRRGSR